MKKTIQNILKKITIDKFYYFPFFGWILPLAFKKDDTVAVYHGKQGFILATFFGISLIALSFITVFLPANQRVMKLIIVILVYLLEITYFIACIKGTIWVTANVKKEFPLIKKHLEKLTF